MPKKQGKGAHEEQLNNTIIVAFLALSLACNGFLLAKHVMKQELECKIKEVNQFSGVVVMECEK